MRLVQIRILFRKKLKAD